MKDPKCHDLCPGDGIQHHWQCVNLPARKDEQVKTEMSEALLRLRLLLEPMHDFLSGEISMFESRGFTSEQARAMASAEYIRLIMAQSP